MKGRFIIITDDRSDSKFAEVLSTTPENNRRRLRNALGNVKIVRRPSMEYSQILSQNKLFEGISEKTLAAIAAISEELTLQEGRLVFVEGSKAEYVYILLEGEVDIQVSLTSRPGSLTVAVVNLPNQNFGWSGIVPPYNYTASALCKTDCRILAMEGKKLMQVLQREPRFGFIVMQRMAELIARRLRNSRIALLKTL